jgi:membrane protein required for colicin V production
MMLIDVLMVVVILISAVSAFHKGLLLEIFSLAGVFFGFIIAAEKYGLLAFWLRRWIRSSEVADLAAFLLIALGVMLAAGLIGRLLRGTVRWAGLGFVDRLLGGFFGFVEGCALVTLSVMAVAAFLPNASWLRNSKLMPSFLEAAHEGSRMTPTLGEKIREGIQQFRIAQPHW